MKYIIVSIGLIILLSGCTSNNSTDNPSSSADWNTYFVVWNGDIYEVTKEQLEAEEIGGKLGEVTKYSDTEGTYSNGFSNKYQEGTELYKIINVGIDEKIAVLNNDGKHVVLRNDGEYGGGKDTSHTRILESSSQYSFNHLNEQIIEHLYKGMNEADIMALLGKPHFIERHQLSNRTYAPLWR